MTKRASKKLSKQLCGACCFIVAGCLTFLAIWLSLLGELPAVETSSHSFVWISVVDINGEPSVPGWAFYFIPAGLFVVAFVVFFFGRQIVREKT